ncbi:MAG TPA: chromate efflux transporter [Roseiflexaceae bacterium]|nr:chromate efflux transporter [Roseiflexaceae bacterium]
MTEPIAGESVPREPYGRLFLRFLRFGLLAFGGPVAQIAMIRQELVEEAHWVSRERFNRALAVYQVLPGPEASELCVYFGMLSRGRLGGLLAGLGFVLPGFVLMFALSWAYATYGIGSPLVAAVFYGCQPAVAALIVRAVHRIGAHALTDRGLWGIALAAGAGQLLGAPFAVTLSLAALAAVLCRRRHYLLAAALGLAFLAGAALVSPALAGPARADVAPEAAPGTGATLAGLFVAGLRAGLLTFGGAYTAIPFVRRDAVEVGGWMTNAQFLDGLAISGVLPAPLVIFVTFVGYLGGGPLGALAMTAGMYLPAFAFTLIGHDVLERAIEHTALHTILEGVTAGVVGLIGATTLQLLPQAAGDAPRLLILLAALLATYWWRAKAAVAAMMLGAGLAGVIVSGALER